MEQFTQKTEAESTVSATSAKGATVVSPQGLFLGKVVDVRISPRTLNMEGIYVRKNLISKPVFISKDYIEKAAPDAVLLKIEPINRLKGKSVITKEGQVLGKVRAIIRSANTNVLKAVVIRKIFKSSQIPAQDIKEIGSETITLRK